MSISNTILSTNEYFILNKRLVQDYGLETTLVLYEIYNTENCKNTDVIEKDFKLKTLTDISNNTTLSISKIKNCINKLYKLKFIDVIVKNPKEKVYIKILHTNISNQLIKNHDQKIEEQKKQKKTGLITNKKRFKKPTGDEVNLYFKDLGDESQGNIFYDYYQSNGWKVGRNAMKCWKSAARNWLKRAKNETYVFPDFYDEKFEKILQNNRNKLTAYHAHLKKLGWASSYSPTAGTTWIKK